MYLDNLECISVEKQLTDFPKHYHETFCISLIHKGIERIDLDEQCLYSEAGSISIANPYEIHSNPLIDSDLPLGFDTIYISKDLMKYLLNGQNINFSNRKINNDKVNDAFMQLKEALSLNNIQKTEQLVQQLANILQRYSKYKKEDYLGLDFSSFQHVNEYIENNLSRKLTLDELARVAHQNKFGFAKKFRLSTGMSPANYVLMKKIFSAKKQISEQSELTQIAFDYDFSDLAHFSKTFKRYIGVSPSNYQNNQRLIL